MVNVLGSDPRDSIRFFEGRGYDPCTAELLALAIMEVR